MKKQIRSLLTDFYKIIKLGNILEYSFVYNNTTKILRIVYLTKENYKEVVEELKDNKIKQVYLWGYLREKDESLYKSLYGNFINLNY